MSQHSGSGWSLSVATCRALSTFFNEVKKEGSVEFSLRIGDRFVEVGEPGYLLWLNNPRPAGESVQVEAGTANRPLIREPIDIPKGAPEVLKRILTRMDIYLRLGEPIDSCLSLRDAVDYLTRYFAGLAVAAFKQLGTLPAEAERLAQSSLSVHDCEKLLILALRSIGTESEEKVGQAVRKRLLLRGGPLPERAPDRGSLPTLGPGCGPLQQDAKHR